MENFISVDWDFVETIVASATRLKKFLPHFLKTSTTHSILELNKTEPILDNNRKITGNFTSYTINSLPSKLYA